MTARRPSRSKEIKEVVGYFLQLGLWLRRSFDVTYRMLFCPGYALALLVSVAGLAFGADAYRKLSDSEIRAKLTGMETSDPHSSEQYMRDGTVRIVTMGRRIVGNWHVKDGKLCIEASKPDDSRCKEVWRSGDKYQFRVEGNPVPYDMTLQKQQQRGW
jgi:hypothetical protein